MSNKKIKFEINKSYKLKHRDLEGMFVVNKVSGGRYHMFSNDLGKDLMLTKNQLIQAIEAAGGEITVAVVPAKVNKIEDVIEVNETSVSTLKAPILTRNDKKYDPNGFLTATPEQVAQFKEEWCDQELERFSEDYQPRMKRQIMDVEIGAMYYYGTLRHDYWYRVMRVENIIKKPHTLRKPKKGEKDEFTYMVVVKEWSWSKKEWGPIRDKAEGYEWELELENFAKEINHPKLSKSPMELYKEAEEAMASGDISKYELDSSERAETEGPDTQVMHLGSKAALDAVHADLTARRNHAELIKTTMTMIVEQKKRELEVVRDKLHGAIALFEKKIKKIYRVITTLELYLGVDEEIVQILEGPAAPESDPICIRQALMYMDEEYGDPDDDGQGIEWKDLSSFGDWLVRNGNYKKVLPESKCIAAFQARRNPKERSGNPYWVAEMKKMDEYTFLVMRNGDNIYRLLTDKIEFQPRLFPKRKELQQLLELWKIADAREEEQREKDRKERMKKRLAGQQFKTQEEYEADQKEHEEEEKEDYSDTYISFDRHDDEERERFEEKFSDINYRGSHHKTGEVKEYAEDHVFFYKMRFTLFQGIIERTQIFQPMPKPIKLFDQSAINEGLVRLIYDGELTLPTGRLTFWEWMKKLNDQIDYGSRIVLSHNWGYISKFIKDDGDGKSYSNSRQERGNRLDDRYTGGDFSRIPKDPNPGLYFVKKGERWTKEPVWIDNPFYKLGLYTTKDEERYTPEDDRKEYPKEIKPYYTEKEYHKYRAHIAQVHIKYEDQIKLFGSIISKSPWYDPKASEKKRRMNHDTGWHVYVLKNPKRLHKYTLKQDEGWDSKNRRMVPIKDSFTPQYEMQDVKETFLCIRYNPKDKIERVGWTWKWDAEERKQNLSWKITKDDGFIINYDLVTVEDIDFYLNSRIDRRHYIHMMPLLAEVKKQLLLERKSEVDFKKLVQGEVFKIARIMPTDAQIDQAVEDWKKNLKWKRAISHDDSKALRMIVQRLVKQLRK